MTDPHPLARAVGKGDPKPPEQCSICQRDPSRTNSDRAECSHVDCPHRRKCWSADAPVFVDGVDIDAVHKRFT